MTSPNELEGAVALNIVRDWLSELPTLDLEDVAADGGVTVGMVVQQQATLMAGKLAHTLDALASITRERDAMREGLTPFAEAARIRLCGEWRDDERIWNTDAASHLTFGHVRRAAALVNGGEEISSKALPSKGLGGFERAKEISLCAAWLDECARYFEKRPTNGEDAAHWANVANAVNARKYAALVRSFAALVNGEVG